MNKLKLIFVLSIAFLLSVGQSGVYVGTPTVIPQYPTSVDSIKIITSTTVGKLGMKLYKTQTTNTVQNTISLTGCYFLGPADQVITHIDTFKIGKLSSGSYSVAFKAYSSYYLNCALKSDSNSVSINFLVIFSNNLKNNIKNNRIVIYPNPTSNFMYIISDHSVNNYKIINSNGVIIKDNVLIENLIDVTDLPNGIYTLKISGDKINEVYKFYKEGD